MSRTSLTWGELRARQQAAWAASDAAGVQLLQLVRSKADPALCLVWHGIRRDCRLETRRLHRIWLRLQKERKAERVTALVNSFGRAA